MDWTNSSLLSLGVIVEAGRCSAAMVSTLSHSRKQLIAGTAPRLCSIAAVYQVPVAPSLFKGDASNLATAVALLNLPQQGSYPPAAASDSAARPRIEEREGQITVVVDDSPRRGTARRESIGLRDRSEWLVILEFEVPVLSEGTPPDQFFKASLPVTRCLDNTVRFQMVPVDDNNTEVSVRAEPKVLPRSTMPFPHRAPSSPSRRPKVEDGWEDGEVHGAGSDESEDDDEGGSWLEGRFLR